jgi:hypothetical protein
LKTRQLPGFSPKSSVFELDSIFNAEKSSALNINPLIKIAISLSDFAFQAFKVTLQTKTSNLQSF